MVKGLWGGRDGFRFFKGAWKFYKLNYYNCILQSQCIRNLKAQIIKEIMRMTFLKIWLKKNLKTTLIKYCKLIYQLENLSKIASPF